MNITIQGVEITLTQEQLLKIDAEVKKMNVPKKPTKEERLIELLTGLTLKIDHVKYPNCIFLFKDDECWVEYESKSRTLWLRWKNIWSVFENEYNLGYSEIQSFIKVQVEEHFKCKGITPEPLNNK